MTSYSQAGRPGRRRRQTSPAHGERACGCGGSQRRRRALIPRRDPCSSCVDCACCCSSPWRHVRQTLVSILHARRGGTPHSHGLITRMVPLSLHRTRCHVFARPCCAVTAGWRGVPPNVTRPRRRGAAVRRTVISTPNRWEVISVTANDDRSASTVVPPALLSLRGSPRPCTDEGRGSDSKPTRSSAEPLYPRPPCVC